CFEIHANEMHKLNEFLYSEFSRRYIPRINVSETCLGRTSAVIYWLKGEGFQVLSSSYSSYGPDVYVVCGDLPRAYTNESPIFFLLQVLARGLAKTGLVLLTDSVAITTKSKTILLMGFPHTGKSTIATIAVNNGLTVRSTENTVVKIEEKSLKIVGGTRVLVFDPKIKDLYGVKVEPTSKTKHGYEILDLDALEPSSINKEEVDIDELYVIYTSFSAKGASISPIKGRKIEKLIWYFATSLIKGLDYYEPYPLNLPIDQPVAEAIVKFIEVVKENYSNKFYEVFGSPLDVVKDILEV
ncbi:MAG: hypothetical protein QXW94_05835, partial [Desulfurococcaceae archaeon]